MGKLVCVFAVLVLSLVSACEEGFEEPFSEGVLSSDLDLMVEDYLLTQLSSKADTISFKKEQCLPKPDANACFDAACDRLGTFGCDSQSEVKTVLKSCKGNHGADCLNNACDKLGTFGCDSLSEVTTVAIECRGIFDGGCVNSICDRLGTFGCDSQSEVLSVIQTCEGLDAECVDFLCDSLGTFGCDSMSEIKSVAAACKE